MTDMNVAKLTSADLPLFNGIIQDLFPAVETPAIDYGKVSWSIPHGDTLLWSRLRGSIANCFSFEGWMAAHTHFLHMFCCLVVSVEGGRGGGTPSERFTGGCFYHHQSHPTVWDQKLSTLLHVGGQDRQCQDCHLEDPAKGPHRPVPQGSAWLPACSGGWAWKRKHMEIFWLMVLLWVKGTSWVLWEVLQTHLATRCIGANVCRMNHHCSINWFYFQVWMLPFRSV